MTLGFTETGWEEYIHWQRTEPQMLRRINLVIRDLMRDPFGGIGKPEPLRNEWSGWWSRRINKEHRLVYRVDGDSILIAQCRYHY